MTEAVVNQSEPLWASFVEPNKHGLWPWLPRRSWLWMLLALAMLAIVTMLWAVSHFENRLDSSARSDLHRAGIDTVRLQLDWSYRGVSVSGVLPQGVSESQLTDVLRATDGGGVRRIQANVKQAVSLPVPVVPAVEIPAPVAELLDPGLAVTVLAENGVVSLSGTVQSEQQRDRLVDAALAAPGVLRIDDDLRISEVSVADEKTDTRLNVLVDLLNHVGPSEVTFAQANLSETELNYRIKAVDRPSAAIVEQAVAVALVDFQITGEIDHVKTGEIDIKVVKQDSVITLVGTVLTEEQQRRIRFAAEEGVGAEGEVIDQINVTGQEARLHGADDRIDRLSSIVSRFWSVNNGHARLHAETLSVSGEVDNETVLQEFRAINAAARESGLVTDGSLKLSAASGEQRKIALQEKFDQLALEIQRTVVFSSGTAQLSASATKTLDKVIGVIRNHPELLIEIEGHTDNVGREVVNEQLSERRAKAVVKYLVDNSVTASRLQPVGYGERRPLVANDTAEGRKKNRRVQFTVVDKF